MGTKNNIKIKPNSRMVHCQKSTTLFKYIQEVPTCLHQKLEIINYTQSDDLLNKRFFNI